MSPTESTLREYAFLFPIELQRHIFDIAIIEHRAMQLTCVARHVQQWYVLCLTPRPSFPITSAPRLEPLIYAKVSLPSWAPLTAKLFMRTLTSRPAAFFAQNVKVILLSDAVDLNTAAKILETCRGLQSITCWLSNWPELLSICPSVNKLQLTHFTASGFPTGPSILNSPFFASITHLGLHISSSTVLKVVEHLPRLTHVACSIVPYTAAIQRWQAILREVLHKCRHLRVFWLVCGGHRDDFLSKVAEGIEDCRVVVHTGRGQWQKFTCCEMGSWEVHEIGMRDQSC